MSVVAHHWVLALGRISSPFHYETSCSLLLQHTALLSREIRATHLTLILQCCQLLMSYFLKTNSSPFLKKKTQKTKQTKKPPKTFLSVKKQILAFFPIPDLIQKLHLKLLDFQLVFRFRLPIDSYTGPTDRGHDLSHFQLYFSSSTDITRHQEKQI